jgi:hypothetical protein
VGANRLQQELQELTARHSALCAINSQKAKQLRSLPAAVTTIGAAAASTLASPRVSPRTAAP